MRQAHSNMMHNLILNGMDGESGMAVGTFDVRPGLNTDSVLDSYEEQEF